MGEIMADSRVAKKLIEFVTAEKGDSNLVTCKFCDFLTENKYTQNGICVKCVPFNMESK